MSAFELGLPDYIALVSDYFLFSILLTMVVSVNKSRADDLVSAIDHGCSRGRNVRGNIRDLIAFDKDVRLYGFDLIITTM